VTVVATVAASAGALLNGAYIDPTNAITETNEEGDEPGSLDCTAVGEVAGGTAEQDNFDCTTHTGGTVNLTITKSAAPIEGTPVATGGTITYTLTAANAASATATANSVVIRDKLGTGLTFVSMTAVSAGVTCGDTTGPEYDCTATSIPPGESRTVTVVATVSATSAPVFNGAYIDPTNTIAETNEDADDPALDCGAAGGNVSEGTDTAPDDEPDNFDCTRHTLTTGSPTATATATATVTAGALVNCPLAGNKWAMSVWNSPTSKPIAEALATCPGVTIVAAYSLDRTTGVWSKYFPAHTDISDLLSLSSMQAIFTLAQ
jgi:uncharacterized repeat protein (TIGR01451 family)